MNHELQVYRRLLRAARLGDCDSLRLLLTKGASVDGRAPHDAAPLAKTCAWGHRDAAALLIDRGASVDCLDRFQRTPLMLAAAQGHTDVVKLLIAAGARVDAFDRDFETPLFKAVRAHSVVVAIALLDAGADVNRRARRSETSLGIAAEGDETLVELLLARGANPHPEDAGKALPIMRASTVAIARRLLDAGAPLETVTNSGWTPLMRAAASGNADLVRMYIALGVDVNRRTHARPAHMANTALRWAVFSGNVPLVRLLLDAGADVQVSWPDRKIPHISWDPRKQAQMAALLTRAGARE